MQVGEVVGSPSGEELGEPHRPERGMCSALFELNGLQVQLAKFFQACGANASEFVEELREGLAAAHFDVTPAIEGVEGFRLAVQEDAVSARKPIFLVSVNQMADYIGDSECAFAFVAVGPVLGEVAKEGVESGRRALEERDGIGEIVGHRLWMQVGRQTIQKERSLRSALIVVTGRCIRPA